MRRPFAVFGALLLGVIPASSLGYRPFDSTDADVVEAGAFGIEAGSARSTHGVEPVWTLLDAAVNYGITEGREVVLEASIEEGRSDDGTRHVLSDATLSLKQLHRRGSLQGTAGVSMASECSLLIPTTRDDAGPGAGCAFIVSQEWQVMSLHFNAGLARERSHEWQVSTALIAEGPARWRVRPAAELGYEHAESGNANAFLLAGMIWRAAEHLSVDVAFRESRHSARNRREWRAGLTWSP